MSAAHRLQMKSKSKRQGDDMEKDTEKKMEDLVQVAEAGSLPRFVRLLRGTAYNLWSACIVEIAAAWTGCSGPPMLHKLFEELRNPQPGDLVMELSTYHMPGQNPLEGIGTLVSVTREPMFTRQEATDAGYGEDEPIPTDKIWTITLDFDDGRKFRWRNASFVKVKTDLIE
jgi:hypothetical protein